MSKIYFCKQLVKTSKEDWNNGPDVKIHVENYSFVCVIGVEQCQESWDWKRWEYELETDKGLREDFIKLINNPGKSPSEIFKG